MDFGVDRMLYPSEIHTIEAIGKNFRINVTQLAELQGITKGAVSQMVYKLVRKKFVKKIKFPRSGKEVFLELTPEGKKAFKGHEKFPIRILENSRIYSLKLSTTWIYMPEL